MSLASLLAAHDDAALEALVSKGLVRRAQRDLEAGLAVVSTRSDTSATVIADGQSVQIDARRLSAARCTCPAGGLCRHILLAVMVLRAERVQPADATAPDDAPQGPSAATEICALTQAELTKFAGADWSAAAALAAASEGTSIVESGRNCTIEFAGASVSVTFIAGQGLKNAAYKGPKTRARVVVAAAAILLRAKNGVEVEATADVATPGEQPLAVDFLASASDTLTRATRIVLAGSSPIAADMLFDLAISARAEAAPRLTAHLRGLARQAGLAMARDVGFEQDTFLSDAARTSALIEGLKADPSNPVLTGSLRRDYLPHSALDLWMLGASCWRSETGARGLTLYSFAPAEKRWHTATMARGAGQDPWFDPRAAYQLPVWGANTAAGLMGTMVHLAEPLVAADRSIALTLPKPGSVTGRVRGARALIEAGAAHANWAGLRRDLAECFGGGLQRRSQPAPALLAPAKFAGFAFDEFAQTYEWEAIDASGDAVVLTVPANAGDLALRLRREGRQIRLVLVIATVGQDRPVLQPIAIFSEKADTLEVVNLDLDHWQAPKGVRAAIDAAQEVFAKPTRPTAPPPDPVRDLATRALDAAVAVATGTKANDIGTLTEGCEAAGLLTLANALDRLARTPDISRALRTAYIANEVRAGLMWS